MVVLIIKIKAGGQIQVAGEAAVLPAIYRISQKNRIQDKPKQLEFMTQMIQRSKLMSMLNKSRAYRFPTKPAKLLTGNNKLTIYKEAPCNL